MALIQQCTWMYIWSELEKRSFWPKSKKKFFSVACIDIFYHWNSIPQKKKIIIISRSLLQPKKERDCLQTALLLAIPETEFWASNYKATICWKGLNHGGRKKWVKELVRSETPLQVAGHPALCRKSNSLACTKTKKSVLQPISRS